MTETPVCNCGNCFFWESRKGWKAEFGVCGNEKSERYRFITMDTMTCSCCKTPSQLVS